MKNEYLEAGRFNGVHGVNGDLKAECWCDNLGVLRNLKTIYIDANTPDKNQKVALKVIRCVPYKDLALIRVEGYDGPEKSKALKNRIFYAQRADIPLEDGCFFIADLIGLRVYDVDTGREYGRVADVSDNAASRLYEIRTEEGKTVYLPAIPRFIVETDLERGIGIRPVKGLFDEN